MYYLHMIELTTRGSAISIDNDDQPATTYTYLNDHPIVYADGERVPNKNRWTLGPVESETEARNLALALAKHYGCDVMINGKPAGLPLLGKPGKWVSAREAASALGKLGGSSTSKRKAQASRANGRKGGRPRKLADR